MAGTQSETHSGTRPAFRRSTDKEIDRCWEIIKEARQFLRDQGWTNGRRNIPTGIPWQMISGTTTDM